MQVVKTKRYAPGLQYLADVLLGALAGLCIVAACCLGGYACNCRGVL